MKTFIKVKENIMSIQSQVKEAINGLEVGEKVTIPKPSKLITFRKFLTEMSKLNNTKYTTKISGNKMNIKRIL